MTLWTSSLVRPPSLCRKYPRRIQFSMTTQKATCGTSFSAGSTAPMSRFEPESFIDYDRLDANIGVVRERYAILLIMHNFKKTEIASHVQAQAPLDIRRETPVRPLGQPTRLRHMERSILPQAPTRPNCMSGCNSTNGLDSVHIGES